jgi:hypothetical protein
MTLACRKIRLVVDTDGIDSPEYCRARTATRNDTMAIDQPGSNLISGYAP